MTQNIVMPQLGESVTEGTIDRWLVKPGDTVKKYDSLAEVTTDKVTAEVPSSFDGVIGEILTAEGETVPVGAVVCTIEVEGELPPAPKKKESSVSSAIMNAGVQKKAATEQPSMKVAQPTGEGMKARYSPAVLRLAQDNDIDLTQVTGSGAQGRITRKDVQAVIAGGSTTVQVTQAPVEEPTLAPPVAEHVAEQKPAPQAVAQQTTEEGDVVIPVTKVRAAIAKNMQRSVTEIPHAWMMMEVDVTDLVAYRDSLKDDFKAREGFSLTYFAFFVKAVAQALKEFPALNSTWAGDTIIQKKAVNLSIAVATDDALFVPVIKNADDKSVKGIAKDIFELAQKTKQGKLTLADMSGGTFTVNNTGSFGSVQSMGIINHPQAAILQIENIVKKPVILPGGMIAARDIVNLCLSLDHRILDGLVCGKFLARVKEILENTNKSTMSVY
ncbi:Dihydrolipoyllysine-residue acetyltransferase component of pyruvate dehydrogenase complex [Metalysinibacillus saudimassiliensis]|uniref:Dihydrolipoamide acetyltransferase component of pyruvate dehydrogenase complex n=1 Tax=Metalysinibacillus saudimassiliensis TaxID=1461583 RepID=A0A078MFF4_9BACL|nr:Dihydrolipoyllysine-residue acetyltransferase component of pyruvate dehydrogenase complex [Metalysinibacillus saudimassiliensis]